MHSTPEKVLAGYSKKNEVFNGPHFFLFIIITTKKRMEVLL